MARRRANFQVSHCCWTAREFDLLFASRWDLSFPGDSLPLRFCRWKQQRLAYPLDLRSRRLQLGAGEAFYRGPSGIFSIINLVITGASAAFLPGDLAMFGVRDGQIEVVAAVAVWAIAGMRLNQRRTNLQISAKQVVGGKDQRRFCVV